MYLGVGVLELATEVLIKIKCLRDKIQIRGFASAIFPCLELGMAITSLVNDLIQKIGRNYTDHVEEEDSEVQCGSGIVGTESWLFLRVSPGATWWRETTQNCHLLLLALCSILESPSKC